MKINLENTNWNYPTPIRFGIDRVKELSLFIDELKISNPLIVTDNDFPIGQKVSSRFEKIEFVRDIEIRIGNTLVRKYQIFLGLNIVKNF